jgi:endonuclease YncB( thermonuclease family)
VVCEADQAPQTRPSFVRVEVPKVFIEVDDGDTILINWPDSAKETVRFLGADTAEMAHPEMGWNEAQPYSSEGRQFLVDLLETAQTVQLARGACADRYGRTLGYLFVDGHDFSAAVVVARLAYETISKYHEQGFPVEAAEVTAASVEAAKLGPLPFENPHDWRAKMRAKAEAEKDKKAALPQAECRYEFDVLTDGRVIFRHHRYNLADYRQRESAFNSEQVIEAWGGQCVVVLNNVARLNWMGFGPASFPLPTETVVLAIRYSESDDLRTILSGTRMTVEGDAFTIFSPRFDRLVLTELDLLHRGPITLYIFRWHGRFESLALFGATRCLGRLSPDLRKVKCGGTDLRLELLEVREFVPFVYNPLP